MTELRVLNGQDPDEWIDVVQNLLDLDHYEPTMQQVSQLDQLGGELKEIFDTFDVERTPELMELMIGFLHIIKHWTLVSQTQKQHAGMVTAIQYVLTDWHTQMGGRPDESPAD